MTVQLWNIAGDIEQNPMQDRIRILDWLDENGSGPRSYAEDSTHVCPADFVVEEQKWPPAWRLLFVSGLSAGLWGFILLSLSFAGVFQFLP